MEYTLSEQERLSIERLKKQLADAEATIVACRGAIQGCGLLIASQQGWDVAAKVGFSDDHSRLMGEVMPDK